MPWATAMGSAQLSYFFKQSEKCRGKHRTFTNGVAGKGKNLVVPKIAPKEQLQHYILEEDTLLQCNAYGIPEPVTGKLLNPQKIDVVFVPLLAFDTTGQRVGYGKGYYDRFLKSCKPTVVSVGLSFLSL